MAWKLYHNRQSVLPIDDVFALKLATRYAKAKVNAMYDKGSSFHHTASNNTDEEEIEKFARDDSRLDVADSKVKDMREAWQQLRAARGSCAEHTEQECTVGQRTAAARRRLRALPNYKSSAEPTLEYYTFSHDPAKSLLNGLSGGKNDQYVLDTKAFKKTDEWSFLFGGSADGRHAFATLQHFLGMKKKRSTAELAIHLTLVDVHPAPLARTLVVFALLQKILTAKANGDEGQYILLHATLFYMYNWHFMPDYFRDIFLRACHDLIQDLTNDAHTLLPFLHIDSQSLDAILTVLRYWSQPLNKSVARMMNDINASPVFDEIEGLPPLPGMGKKSRKPGPRKPNAYDDYEGEKDVFLLLPVLLPPKSLVSRHPAVAELTRTYATSSAPTAAAKAKKEVLKTWQLNPSIFVNGYTIDIPNPFNNIDGYAKAVKEFQLKSPPTFCSGSNSFDITAQYFEIVADAIEALRDGLKIEILLGDVISGVPRLLEGDLATRPDSFPKEYTRMWLSNVPDYTHGFLSTTIYLLRYLQPGQLAISNILLNSGVWRSMVDFCYSHALLHPIDFPRFLGCEVIYTRMQTWDEMALKAMPLPRQIHRLASKKELHDWLARLLLCILRNGEYRGAPTRVPMPANLGMFFHLLVHLCRVGFPAHWIGDFVQALVSNTLLTDARPYVGQLPITSEYIQQKNPVIKVNLSPWRANLEVIVASTKASLPFAVSLPPEFPTFADIFLYSARITPALLMPWMDTFSEFTNTLGMILYKPHGAVNGDSIAWSIAHIIDGRSTIKGAEAQIILSLEQVNIAKGEVSWRMSKQWYDKMRSEVWTMVIYRDDSHAAVTTPLPAAKWHKV
ncbi:hypothetical protein D9619_008661 [Psilocybe cf. subviscida]|uniref:DUF4470 domain-containing protein n=1 Tax=Psilocybe cf. subviscida TaxID=2480587 RepID=A0A8H5BAL3_9AGAR|nr:hypothetical protein D9619_008661 [Psilocybe cf. subviscida]